MKLYRVSMLIVLVLVAAQLGWFLPRLPERIAASFAFDGTPNGYDSKDTFFFQYAMTLAFTAGIFLALPAFLRRVRPGLVNMPNAEYWLAPERRARTLDDLAEGMGWFGVFTLFFLGWSFHLTILANLDEPPVLASGPFWSGFFVYLLYVGWFVVRMIRRYGRVPPDAVH